MYSFPDVKFAPCLKHPTFLEEVSWSILILVPLMKIQFFTWFRGHFVHPTKEFWIRTVANSLVGFALVHLLKLCKMKTVTYWFSTSVDSHSTLLLVYKICGTFYSVWVILCHHSLPCDLKVLSSVWFLSFSLCFCNIYFHSHPLHTVIFNLLYSWPPLVE